MLVWALEIQHVPEWSQNLQCAGQSPVALPVEPEPLDLSTLGRCSMPGPLDATLKHLTELSPQDWVVQRGWSAAPARIIDADIATIAGAADKVIRVDGRPAWLL